MATAPTTRTPAVFLDRDDTLIANREVTARTPHPGDLTDPALVRLLPGVAMAMPRLKQAGFLRVVVSNQGCVARGVCGPVAVDACNRRMRELLRKEGGPDADVEAVYTCPYHPKGSVPPWNVEHPWRKPQPGMLIAASCDLRIDLRQSWMIGDAPRDIEAAVAAGIPTERTLLLVPGEAGAFADAVERILAT
jgi:D-glycero-D-manno-heptose 1,7-bisphosphate phosphatase